MWQVVAGRIISGIGAAGMSVIVSILITGLSSLRLVYPYQADHVRPSTPHPSSIMEKLRECHLNPGPEHRRTPRGSPR